MMNEKPFVHARTFDTRWGLALAFIDLIEYKTDEIEVLKLQLWQPVGENREMGKMVIQIGLSDNASDEAHEAMSAANRSALVEMTTEKFEEAMCVAGVSDMLDRLHS